jgi:hypothetical protein
MGRASLIVAAAAILTAWQGSPSPDPPPSPADAGGCPFPSVRPTYLPWLSAGEDVPPPRMSHASEEGGSSASLEWRNPNWEQGIPPSYVTLRRQTEPNLGAPGDPVAVTIDGSDEGGFYEGEVPGDAAISWVIPNATSCSTVALELVAPDMSRSEAKREIVKIAESLRPTS